MSDATNPAVSLSDAPSGDLTFEQLFPSEPEPGSTPPAQLAPTTVPTEPQQTAPPALPQAPVADEPFLKGSKSVYKTREAALEGVNQKDALIEQLRTRYALTTGIDPITGQPVTAPVAAPVQHQNYAQNPKQYLSDLANAAQKGDPDGYAAAQAKYIYDVLEPIAPIITATAREQALRATEQEVKDFRTFYGSSDYQAALDSNPELRGAIEFAESDIRNQARLPGLYKLTYQVSQGMRLPEMLKSQQTQQANTQPQRTVTPGSTPPPPQPAPAVSPKTSEGRKAMIAQMEAQGILERSF